MVMQLTQKDNICPDSRRLPYTDIYYCKLNDKVCLLESSSDCAYYNDWLKEVENEGT